jgi:hypothetical protein
VKSPASAEYIEEATQIGDLAGGKGIALKVMGCCAVKIHCRKWRQFHENVLKRHVTDIDFMALSKDRERIHDLLCEIGYEQVRLMMPQHDRLIFEKDSFHIDVFLDQLSMCHVIDFRNRIGADSPTISLADILLEKLQIVRINEKDVKDLIVLLREHEVGEGDNETINATYVSRLLAVDWGFSYTATTNLTLMKDQFIETYCRGIMQEDDIIDIRNKVTMLLDSIEREPKSIGWKMRARTGPKKKWYQDVEEVKNASGFQDELARMLREQD